LVVAYLSSLPSRVKGTTAAYIKQGKRRTREIRETIMIDSVVLAVVCAARCDEEVDC